MRGNEILWNLVTLVSSYITEYDRKNAMKFRRGGCRFSGFFHWNSVTNSTEVQPLLRWSSVPRFTEVQSLFHWISLAVYTETFTGFHSFYYPQCSYWRCYAHSSQPTISQLPLIEEVHCRASGRTLNCPCHENSRLHIAIPEPIALLCECGCRNWMRRSTTPKRFRPSRFRYRQRINT